MLLNYFPDQRPNVIVISHERSGTHFLINSLATCYGYINDPYVDLDRNAININYYDSTAIGDVLLKIGRERSLANVVKSHHPSGFFKGELDRITKRYVVFYILRDPVRVMMSFWQFLHQWHWMEGPKVKDPIMLIKTEPCGQLMRYQLHQYKSMLKRWESHVNGWLKEGDKYERVVVVRFEDLDQNYKNCMTQLATVLEHDPVTLEKPSRDQDVIPGGPALATDIDEKTLRSACRKMIRETMLQLNY